MSRVNAINVKKKKLRRRFENEIKKISKNVEFYRYSKLIRIFKRATFDARSH